MWGRIIWWLGHGTDSCGGGGRAIGRPRGRVRAQSHNASAAWEWEPWRGGSRGDAARRSRGCHGGSAWTCQSAEPAQLLVVVGSRPSACRRPSALASCQFVSRDQIRVRTQAKPSNFSRHYMAIFIFLIVPHRRPNQSY